MADNQNIWGGYPSGKPKKLTVNGINFDVFTLLILRLVTIMAQNLAKSVENLLGCIIWMKIHCSILNIELLKIIINHKI